VFTAQFVAAPMITPALIATATESTRAPLAPQSNTAMIGGFVWLDKSRNGLQGGTERGIPGAPVALLDANSTPLATTMTGPTGHYTFTSLAAGTYRVAFARPEDFIFTEQDACGDLCGPVDSDANVDTGLTDPIDLADGEHLTTISAGLIQIRFAAFMANINRAPSAEVCDPSSPYWMAVKSGNSSYTFCSKQDLEFVAGLPPVVNLDKGSNQDLSLKWNIFGINGIRLKIESNTQYCGQGGSQGSRDVPVNGSDGPNNYTYTLNANEFGYGGFKIELFITTKQDQIVGYNEKFLCFR
jgi:hypothetical protein